ncbi:MAG: PBP1A family penicillin-binding protein [Atopobiaceae bacterium]|jgi:1A family penicillin-binding protein
MGIRNRRARKHAHTHIVGFGLAGVIGFVALLVIALVFSVTSLVNSWLTDLPDYTSADAYLVAEPTEVYDSSNNLIAEYYLQNRKSITIDQVSTYVLKGTVDTEDVRFYQHNGVDPQGIIRAMVAQLGGNSEGASTITQQLVRNTILSDEQFDKTLKRKVREAYIAIQMEKTYSKDQILMMYLNTIYYGHSAYGIEAASVTYFNKDAKDLTLSEAATLIGLPNSPSLYDPTVNPDACKQRRNVVLDRMLSAGDITQEEHDAAQAEDIELDTGSSVMSSKGTYPYFTDYVKQLLLEDFDQKTVFQGGLKVYTTLDPTDQQAAEDACNKQLESIGDDSLEAALVAVDPSTGYIKAMVGGRDYDADQYNLASQARRQPGSGFKAFTLAAAISAGMSPQTYINCNSPIQVTSSWKVQNHYNTSYGTITLARATELSSNTGYAQVANAIGADSIVSTAKAMGIKVDLPNYASITLGTIGVPPLQMAEGYATLAAGGVHRDAIAIDKILDRNGNSVYQHTDAPTQAISAEVAYAETQVLEGVVKNGTATVVNSNATINQPIAGKTGTTEYAGDLWFNGYTPQIAVSVWVGHRESGEKTVYVHGSTGSPATTSCPIFASYVNATLSNVSRQEFQTAASPDYKSSSSWTFSKSSGSSSSSGKSYSSSDSSNYDAGASE